MALDKEKTLVAAQKYANKDQHEKAIREYLKILEVEPNEQRVLLLLASSYERLGKMSEAGDAYVKMYEIYRNQGAYQKALAIIKQAQKCLPDSDEVAMNMAEIYSALGLPHEAVNQLEKCLERAEKEKNHRTYARILQTMVRVDGENVQTRIRYAQMLQEDGDTEGACRQYVLALAQLLSKERFVDYIQTARDYLKISPKDAEVLQSLAGIFIRMNRFSDALSILMGLNSDERTPEIREHLITCYTKMNRRQDAVNELKALARQYESMQSRSDLIESVWLRAQKLAPNDPEVLTALEGDDIPLLSDSALNVVTSANPSQPNSMMANAHGHEANALDRMLQSKYDEALFYYNRGNLDGAKTLCMQIIAGNEQHLPALRLLSQILEQTNDLVTLAQIERKIARAVYETDLDEAVQHVLRAEQCTPRAWENFNLMLVFGLEPAQYGMQAPESTGVSNSRIPTSQINVAVNAHRPAAAPPPLPRKVPSVSTAMPPSLPNHTPSSLNPAISSTRQAIPGSSLSGTRSASNAYSATPSVPNAAVSAPRQAVPATPYLQASSPSHAAVSSAHPAVPPTPLRQRASSISMPQAHDTMTPMGTRPHVPSREISQRTIHGQSQRAPQGYPQRNAGYGTPNFASPYQVSPQTPPSSNTPIDKPNAEDIDNAFNDMFQPQDAGASKKTDNAESAATDAMPAWMQRSQGQQAGRVPSRQSTRATIAAPSAAYLNSAFSAVPPSSPAGTGAETRRRPTGIHSAPVPPQNESSPSSGAPYAIPKQPSGQIPVISRQPSGQIPAISRQPSGQIPAISRQPSGQIPVISRQPTEPNSVAMPPVGISPEDRQNIEESIQEIEFYASVNLMPEARGLLNNLIQKYGDVDIIHDLKMRIDAMP